MIILGFVIVCVVLYYVVRIGVRDGAIDVMKNYGTIMEEVKRKTEEEKRKNMEYSNTVEPYKSEEWRNY